MEFKEFRFYLIFGFISSTGEKGLPVIEPGQF